MAGAELPRTFGLRIPGHGIVRHPVCCSCGRSPVVPQNHRRVDLAGVSGGYRGCMTVSSRAGSPRSTTAIARLMAGPRSLGSEIGPSAYQPML